MGQKSFMKSLQKYLEKTHAKITRATRAVEASPFLLLIAVTALSATVFAVLVQSPSFIQAIDALIASLDSSSIINGKHDANLKSDVPIRLQRKSAEVQDPIANKVPPQLYLDDHGVHATQHSSDIFQDNDIVELLYRPGPQFLRYIIKAEDPVMINYDKARIWPISRMSLLTLAQSYDIDLNDTYLQYKNQIFVRYRPARSPTHIPRSCSTLILMLLCFLFSGREREKGGMLGSMHDLDAVRKNVTMEAFVKAALRPEHFLYSLAQLDQVERITGPLTSNWRDLRVLDESIVTLNNPVMVSDHSVAGKIESEKRNEDTYSPQLVLSHPGVVFQPFYDASHSVYVQLQGYRTVYIFSPRWLAELHSFPNIDVRYMQSQLPLHEPRIDSTGAPVKLNCTAVRLKPGDVLYVPPYHTTYIVGETLSASLSIKADSLVQSQLTDIFRLKMPLGEYTSNLAVKATAVTYLLHLISRYSAEIFEDNSLRYVAEALYASRFERLYPIDASNTDEVYDLCAASGGDASSNSVIADLERNAKLLLFARYAVDRLRKVQTRFVEVKRAFIFDYFEHLSRFAVGSPRHVPAFVKICLTRELSYASRELGQG